MGEITRGLIKWAAAVAIPCALILINVGEADSQCDDSTTFPDADNTDFIYGGLYIDTENPIPCSGTVEAWHFCYFPPPPEMQQSHFAVELSVYQRDLPINLILYTQRPDSVYVANFTGRELQRNHVLGDYCMTVPLSQHNQFSVQEGDIVGVYIGEVFSSNDSIQGLRDGNIIDVIGTTSDDADPAFIRRVFAACQSATHTRIIFGCLGSLDQHQIQARVVFDYTKSTPSMNTPSSSTPPKNGPTSTPKNSQVFSSLTGSIQPTTATQDAVLQTSRQSSTQKLLTNSGSMPINNLSTVYLASTQFTVYPTRTQPAVSPTIAQSRNVFPIVPVSVAGVCVIVILLVAVIITIVVIVLVHRKRKANLELIRWRRERRQHDHFVRVSEFFRNKEGNLLSSTPQPYEEPQISTPLGLSTDFENPVYSEYDEGFVIENERATYSQDTTHLSSSSFPRLRSYLLNSEQPALLQPIYSEVDMLQARTSMNGGSGETEGEITPTHIENIYSVVDKSMKKLSIAPPRESRLYEHYYRTLEEIDAYSSEDSFTNPASSEKDLLDQFEQAQFVTIPSKEIKTLAHLGSGQFGKVSRGVWKKGKETLDIAIKSSVSSKNEDKSVNRIKLLQEAIIMGQFHNPNVILFYGMVTTRDTVMLVMELAAKGDLEHLLVSMVPDPGEMVAPNVKKVLLGFCQQVAFGMHYLSSKGFVHRDLAARNILVTKDNVLKIADFGMSRDLANEDYYMSHGGKIPVKWTAPEAIHYKKYSTASDVWAYGCLLYEIWSLGQAPFRDYSNTEALCKLSTGYRLPPPPGCPRLIYDIIIRCWNPEPQQRTLFKVLIFELLEPEKKILHLPEEGLATHQLAGVIGGPLEAGEKMYSDLQSKYLQ